MGWTGSPREAGLRGLIVVEVCFFILSQVAAGVVTLPAEARSWRRFHQHLSCEVHTNLHSNLTSSCAGQLFTTTTV
ncbi:hypothetical protein JKP88DRAFT_221518 [Tribonema minus]|uniref:Uncharacterized protein n=1 Tax=Tribonema minus TaxID=303371 RepID=A0A835YWB4_9STRA|nr:hypothetical protein JKP88DRAFT_221518 [Tribonema minus]